MTTPSSPSTGRLSTWVRTHQRDAVLGAGGAGVVVLALVAKHRAGTSSTSATDPVASSSSDANGTAAAAGLTGAPYTGDDGAYTDLAQQISDLASQVNSSLSNPTPPPAPKTPTPAPKPGTQRYTIVAGDTLQKIAGKVYGETSSYAVALLKRGTPILAPYPATATLSYLAGDTIAVPAWKNPPTAHKPTPKPKPKPKPKAKAPRTTAPRKRKT